ncbi:MAG: type II methionyl aminopeptidase [Candidatus Aenigmatarchaeota archaeon]
MDEEVLNKYKRAGEIAKEARKFGKGLIEPGNTYLDVVEGTESKIRELGGRLGFPTNLSVNDAGAHDTADINDRRKLEEGDIVKLDVGVHVDGYIADTAVTVSLLPEKEEMVEVANMALKNALNEMRPGNKILEVSEVIEDTIRENEYNPIVNLTGHGLERYELHARTQILNVRNQNNYVLKEGDVFAVEPFVTDGVGKVREGGRTLIYMYSQDKSVRMREGKKILNLAKEEYGGLPFSKRWLKEEISPLKINMALKQLTRKNALRGYPVLKEVGNGDIAQAEHTVIVKEKPLVTTR